MSKKYILIDTKNINTVNKYNFRYYLPEAIEIKNYIKLKMLLMARMNYFINDTNNTFKIKIYKDINYPVIINFTLPKQSYTPLSLCQTINSLFTTYNNITFTVSYNQNNYQITFNSNYDFDLDLTLSSFHRVISLERNIYKSDNYYNISGLVNFNTPYYIKLNINNLTSTNILNNEKLETSWIVPIINKNFAEIIEYNDYIYNLKLDTNIKTNYLDISILDDYDNLFDNNNYNWYALFEYQ